MATQFFEMQQRALVRTRWALFGFLSCVLLTILSITLLTGVILVYVYDGHAPDTQAYPPPPDITFPAALIPHAAGMATAALITGFIILASALTRYGQLAAGPECVMKALGGWRLPPDTGDPGQQRLRNVVEEMAIASGIPVPEIYILNDQAINACAVGLSVDRAAVGVTHGALATFTRDELQGVIAHEFSHILYGDMRLNTRLISWLAGLFMLSEIGALVMHMGLRILRVPRRRSRKDNGAAIALAIVLIGCLIWICGSLGLLFGKILQAAISRQREFLADAAAVQFTRNPHGIGNALRKLGKGSAQSRIHKEESTECAHMMFGSSCRGLSGMTATHPPLHRRIREVLPDWDGTYLRPVPAPPERPASPPRTPPPPPPAARALSAAAGAALLNEAGSPDPNALDFSRAWLQQLPPAVLRAAHDPSGARALVYRLLLHKDGEAFRIQRDALMQHEETDVLTRLQQLNRDLPGIPPENRMPLLDLCIPALRGLEPNQKAAFAERVQQLIAADGQVSLYEFALQQIVTRALEDEEAAAIRNRGHTRLRQHIQDVNVLLSALAALGADTIDQVRESFRAAATPLAAGLGSGTLTLLPGSQCGVAELEIACGRLAHLPPDDKERLMRAALEAVAVSGEIRPGELHVFRAAAAMLNVPVSPNLRITAPDKT